MSSSSEQQLKSIWRTVPGLNERMKELMVQVYSMTVIADMLAKEFSIPVTKNMVISRSRREGFKSRNAVSRGRPRKQTAVVAKHIALPASVAQEPRLTGHAVATVDLRASDCKWPLTSEHPWMHCGQQQVEGHSYCAVHCAASYPGWGKVQP